MFEILPASAAGREATTGHALVSITAHAGLIVAAALLTAQVAGTPSVRAPVEPLVYIPSQSGSTRRPRCRRPSAPPMAWRLPVRSRR